MSARPYAETLAERTPISLDELVADAELLSRVDRKYVLAARDADAVVARLDDRVRVLDIDGERSSTYETVYFDTPDLLSFRLAAHGRRRRFKLRSRVYVGTGTAFLEMKTRGGRGLTVKERIPQPSADADRLTAPGREYAGAAIEPLGFGSAVADALVPTLRTTYRRSTLALPDGSRATVDDELEWLDASGARLTTPHLVIVETKSAGRVSPLDRLLWSAGVRPVGISKFATGLAALRPDLPSNKWSRVLRTHFPTTPTRSS